MDGELVAGRECGACGVCCIDLTIDSPEFQKLPGYRCENCPPGGGCTIYETRPQTCRSFHCGWRRLRWIGPNLRPDISRVLVRLTNAGTSPAGRPMVGVIFTLLDRTALDADGLAEGIAAAVRAGVPVDLHVPGPPGFTSGRARINAAMADAVGRRDKPAMLDILRRLHDEAGQGARRPVILAAHDQPHGSDPHDPPGGPVGGTPGH